MEISSKEKVIFDKLKRKLPLIFHHATIYDENTMKTPTITPTTASKYLMTGKRVVAPFYKSISRLCVPISDNLKNS